jgi:hypothetical protein
MPLFRVHTLVSILAMSTMLASARSQPQPPDQPPDFGPNVLIMDASMKDIQSRLDAIFKEQEKAQFGAGRHAILFKPGKYDADVRVGFYTQVLGLGRLPDDVTITGAVRSTAEWMKGNATCNFWRGVENLSVTPRDPSKPNVWAVSQGTALRRVHIRGDLHLWDQGWSSGGFLADSAIDGTITSGSQQQWMSRNSDWGAWQGGNWNMVFVGVTNPPSGAWPDEPYTVIDQTPIIREKPFLFVDDAGKYNVMVPELLTSGSRGTSWSGTPSPGEAIGIERFFIARAGRDTAESINAALEAGKHLILTPGVYHLDGSLRVTKPDTIVLGLGYPTLVPDRGTPAITLADVDGVKVCGLILDAGAAPSRVLMQVGEKESKSTHAGNPVLLYDLCARAGGSAPGSVETFLEINSANVIGDNVWLWRADHGAGAAWDKNPNEHGLVVRGADVTFYGLFVEHTRKHQTLWNGERGRVYFYQSEMPYDPPSQKEWSHDGVRGYSSYKVADGVKMHEAWGLGVYCVFRAAPVVADSAIEAPDSRGVRLHHVIAVRLDGLPESGISHVLNDKGAPVITTMTSKLD